MTLEDVYEKHWSQGDWTPAFEFYADDFEWGWSSEFLGIEGVYADVETPNTRLRSWLSPWEYWYCEAEDYVRFAGVVVVLTRYRGRGKGSGVEIEQDGAHLWVLRDGKAKRLEVFADRELALRMAAELVQGVLDELPAGTKR